MEAGKRPFAPRSEHVGMGQISSGAGEALLHAVLGSCVGVALYHPRARVGALGHIVLPDSSGREASAGKFADTAIPAMIRECERQGAARAGLVAKIAGGACMFGGGGPLQIGEANLAAVAQRLAQAGIRIAAEDTGGSKGRRVTLDCATGQMAVQVVGQSTRIL
jgi:chemotaxis protein CheD